MANLENEKGVDLSNEDAELIREKEEKEADLREIKASDNLDEPDPEAELPPTGAGDLETDDQSSNA